MTLFSPHAHGRFCVIMVLPMYMPMYIPMSRGCVFLVMTEEWTRPRGGVSLTRRH